jgi:hypothetical protein
VRCADDPYVMAAGYSRLSLDFGVTQHKLDACSMPDVPCARDCERGILMLTPLVLLAVLAVGSTVAKARQSVTGGGCRPCERLRALCRGGGGGGGGECCPRVD